MPRVTYIEANGTQHTVDVPVGMSVMQGAVNNLVPGIEGDCGGLCACATCHVYVTQAWLARCTEPEELEINILDFAFDVRANSRLACQLEVTDAMDGFVVELPERQY
ncbi:MAG: 2Fe-2S iron-sulfur cluster binding domain-containing protein [Gammaproteobacteria bacterium]|nr:2Fe-2S iron-sulfur cluster binding domain-containing protein [Gammaproteobacteria bacterium]